MTTAIAPEQLWETHPLRAFISYADPDIEQARNLKSCLSSLKISPFVAQENIHPGLQWGKAIECALTTMDVFIPLLSQKSKNRFWPNQEIGFAYARKEVPIIPVKLCNENPFGLIASIQAIEGQEKNCDQVAAEIIKTIFLAEKPKPQIVDTLVLLMKNAQGSTAVNFAISLLPHISQLDEKQEKELVAAINSNPIRQVSPDTRRTATKTLSEITGNDYFLCESETSPTRLLMRN